MSILHRRIAHQPTHAAAHMGEFHPVAPQPMNMPLSLVQVTADGLSVTEAVPLYTARGGAPVPATGPGQWDQLYAAGRP